MAKKKTRGAKRQNTTHEHSGRAKKVRKLSPGSKPTPASSHAEDVSAPSDRTPATKRMASHASLLEHENIVYAADMETQIAAETRGATRKDIPLDTFRSVYLCDFSAEALPGLAPPGLAVNSVKKIGEGNWKEQLFWGRLRQSLSDEVRCSGCTFIRLSVLC